MKRQLLLAIGGVLLFVFTAVAITNVRDNNHKIQLRDVQLQERGAELKKLELKYQNLNIDLEKTDKANKAEIERLEKEKQELDTERQRLERELQAKLQRKEAERVAIANAQQKLANTVTATKTASAASRGYTGGGNKDVWLAASGIPRDQWWAVDSIVSRESGWNPCAYNPGRSDCNANPSSACGLAQSLPCGKQAKYGHWTDPVANLKWQYEYVTARYGGYPQAVAFWNANHWY